MIAMVKWFGKKRAETLAALNAAAMLALMGSLWAMPLFLRSLAVILTIGGLSLGWHGLPDKRFGAVTRGLFTGFTLAWLATGVVNGLSPLLALTAGAALASGLLAVAAALRSRGSVIDPEMPSISPGFRDYLQLTKPVVTALLLVTTLGAMVIAQGAWPPLGRVLWTLLGGALSSGGASALNHFIDRRADKAMHRTRRRPLPSGRMMPDQVLAFGLLLCIAGFYTLALAVNLMSALLALAGMLYYAMLYSLWLKPSTPQNIVVGGGAGAIPPLVGWAAVSGSLNIQAFFLFALIFFWTPPHFWALALLRRRDYARAGVPMLPVVYGERGARLHILLYSLQLVALTMLLPLVQLGSALFVLAAGLLGASILRYAWRLWREGGQKRAWAMYRFSNAYLAMIFIALVADTLVAL